MKTTADILNRAADRLEKPGAWIQSNFSKDKDGKVTGPQAPDACQWCMYGAVYAEATTLEEVETVVAAIKKTIGTSPISMWNDQNGRTQGEVVTALRKAAGKELAT